MVAKKWLEEQQQSGKPELNLCRKKIPQLDKLPIPISM